MSSSSASSSLNGGFQAPRPSIILQNLTLERYLGENENMRTPLGFCIGMGDHVAVVDTDNNRVLVYNHTTGVVVFTFGSYGTGNGSFVNPRKVKSLTPF